MLLAEPFAGTTAGYLTGLGTPVIALLVGAMWRSWAHRLALQDKALGKMQEAATESNKALAILLSDHNHVASTVVVNSSKISELEKSTAVLSSRVDEHHRWVERQQAAGNPHAL
jgi:hypothetical protein